MKRNVFKTNSEHKTTMDIGLLYPLQFLDVMRGQTTLLSNSALLRFQPMLAPAMTRLNFHVVSFYVPYRIVWEGWNDFISGQKMVNLPLSRLLYAGGFDNAVVSFKKTLLEYAGFPKNWGVRASEQLEMEFPFLWFSAYYKIWNDHFRDPDLQDEIDLDALFQEYKDGVIADSDASKEKWNEKIQKLFGLKRCNWGSDRYTKALLESQSDPTIQLPVGSNGKPMQFSAPGQLGTKVNLYSKSDGQGTIAQTNRNSPAPWTGQGPNIWENNPLLYAGGLTGVDMTDFKLATALYNFKINQNRFGSRVEDYFKKYDIRDMDTRLKNSEIIGGFSEVINITDIIATDATNLGKQGGHASGQVSRRRFKHYAPEDGVIITLAYLRPKADYVGGIPRFFLKRDMLDFYQKEFENVGYQPIYTLEVGNNRVDTKLPADEDQLQIFGYEPRYNEYRREQNLVTGELTPGEPLAHWANPRYWSNTPFLNKEFVECNPSNQIWASPNTDKCICWFDRKVTKKCFLTSREDPRIKL